uniref:Ig-like domain-containing protein n=1 Tax=Oryzias melastigma TaxID=30732 RepID=A0A3B3DW81_ORYME
FLPLKELLLTLVTKSYLVIEDYVTFYIRAVPGQNVTLPCRAPKSNPIIAIEWFKPGEEETYLLLYRAGLVLPDGQHPAYRNRVAFQKEQTKDGDASVTLRAVTVEDSGTYTCVVSQRETSQTRSRQILPTTFIRLTVDPAPSCELLQLTLFFLRFHLLTSLCCFSNFKMSLIFICSFKIKVFKLNLLLFHFIYSFIKHLSPPAKEAQSAVHKKIQYITILKTI